MPAALPPRLLSRRALLAAGVATVATGSLLRAAEPAAAPEIEALVEPLSGKRLLLSCKLGMIPGEANGAKLALAERLRMAGEAGFDGVDFDQAGEYTPQQARAAVLESGVFVHNAINHAHWNKRLSSPSPDDRDIAVANLEHCLRVSHAAGGSGVLIVLGKGEDGPAEEIEQRARQELKKVVPLAAALGQPILIENVWNRMMYDHDAPPEQSADRFISFVDSFQSPWVGMYYDVGNSWKFCQPDAWIRAFGHRCVKLDIKGFSRAKDTFVEIASADDDVPWNRVRRALADIGFAGWATAEVRGGDLTRLTEVRTQMEKVLLS